MENNQKNKKVAVIGTGTMGNGIAQTFAQGGYRVVMKDLTDELLQRATGNIDKSLSRMVAKEKMTEAEKQAIMSRISTTLAYEDVKDCILVVEAVGESMELKKRIFTELDEICNPDCMLATNSSSLSITEIAAATKRPEKVIGMHFFNPVPKMPLVEVVRAEKSSPQAVMQTVAFGRQLGKTVIVVKDRPGFLVNRILMPFLNECGHLRAEGYSIAQIDKAATTFGMPMGPFRLLDEVGLDTGSKVARVIADGFPHMKVLPLIDEMVEKNYLGKKNGRGFYSYSESGKALAVRPEFQSDPKNPSPETDRILQDRLILPMVTEAVMALDEGIVATVRDLDIGLIFGIGFPPFRGGLLKWVSDLGEREILDRMNALHNATKGRIVVPASLSSRVSAGQKFYH